MTGLLVECVFLDLKRNKRHDLNFLSFFFLVVRDWGMHGLLDEYGKGKKWRNLPGAPT